jgi:hypothetical protein
VDWAFSSQECEWLEIWFQGGVTPYSLYYAISHASNNVTWSEDMFVTSTSNVLVHLQLTPNIGTSFKLTELFSDVDFILYSSIIMYNI